METNPNDLIHSFRCDKHDNFNLAGLTKREYFAAMALQGIMSSNECGVGHIPETASEWAVRLSDALIKSLNDTEKN